MTNLMEVLFQFLQEKRIPEYLAQNPDYQNSAHQTELYLEKFSKSLDYSTGLLLDQYREAAYKENRHIEQALFQAALDLGRELREVL